MIVAINLQEDKHHLHAWSKFLYHLEQMTSHKNHDEWMQIAQAQLAQYEAWTDWSDDQDPIWFRDLDGLTHFVLTWS